ncbi:MAG TPA: hypothetical protein VNM91_01915 [Dehalococcoidia bacterium]|nr:hypothetical protein [Dehalococcoidia bacterium]
MANPSVITTTVETDVGWLASVRVVESGASTDHRVHVSQADFERLAAGTDATPDELVRESFEFLLEREPKESIMREFGIMVIARYFPEYEREIRRRLATA